MTFEMDLMYMLKQQMTPDVLAGLTQKIGAQDTQQTEKAVDGALATLVGAMKNNAANKQSGNAFLNAIDKDHDGSILDDVMGYIGGNHGANTRAANGTGILKHLLGQKQNNAFSMISQLSGLNKNQSGSLMATLAPMVMGMLGKQRRQQSSGMDLGGLFNMLNGTMSNNRQRNQNQGLIEKFLDADGDGSIVDDLAGQVGKGLLGKLFGRK